MGRFVIGLDGSPESMAALQFAREKLLRPGDDLVLARCVQNPSEIKYRSARPAPALLMPRSLSLPARRCP
eukprot:tig00020675_g12595.t1